MFYRHIQFILIYFYHENSLKECTKKNVFLVSTTCIVENLFYISLFTNCNNIKKEEKSILFHIKIVCERKNRKII